MTAPLYCHLIYFSIYFDCFYNNNNKERYFDGLYITKKHLTNFNKELSQKKEYGRISKRNNRVAGWQPP